MRLEVDVPKIAATSLRMETDSESYFFIGPMSAVVFRQTVCYDKLMAMYSLSCSISPKIITHRQQSYEPKTVTAGMDALPPLGDHTKKNT